MSTSEPQVMSSDGVSRRPPSLGFQRAIDKFTKELSAKHRADFANTNLEDVYGAIKLIQEKRGSDKSLRHMRKMQAFLEAMDQYRKVIEAFLNCTPFMGYVWVGALHDKHLELPVDGLQGTNSIHSLGE